MYIYIYLFFHCFTDVFNFGVWKKYDGDLVSNDHLRQLSNDLPNIIAQSRSVNTRKSYEVQFKKWIKWCRDNQINAIFPAKDFHVALFLVSLIQSGFSFSVIESAFYSLKWAHDITGVVSPCGASFVRFTLDAAKKLCSTPVQKKKPISADIIHNMFLLHNPETTTVYHLRSLTLIVIGFAGFLRISELLGLRCCDVVFNDSHLRLHIRSSKTDQTHSGSTVLIAKSDGVSCPYKLMKLYFAKAGLVSDSVAHIFRSLSFCKKLNVFKLRKGGTLSYTRVRELLREKLLELGLSPDEYGTHSLRRGGATASALNNVSDRLFKKHGRWKSDNAKDGYVSEDLEKLLSVSKSLGL